MRRNSPSEPAPVAKGPRNDWQTIRSLLPYLTTYKWRVAFALTCLIGAKVANLGVPIVMKKVIDSLSSIQHLTALGRAQDSAAIILISGVGLLVVAYAVVRLSTSLFTELREMLFAKVTESAVRQLALKVFRHLHSLSLRFHLDRQTGGMSRDIERGTRGIQQLVSYSLYSILPTLVEVGLVLGFFVAKYEAYYAIVTLIALVTYIVFTIKLTEWRTHFRRTMNELDSKANSRAIDSLLNYETVKYFGNEEWEAQRYDENLRRYRDGGDSFAAFACRCLISGSSSSLARGSCLSLARDARRGRRASDARRSRADQHVHAAVVYPAEFPGRGVSRAQAESHRYGPHVHLARRRA